MTLEATSAHKPDQVDTVSTGDCQSLGECLSIRLRNYFRDLDNHPTGNLHALVMAEVEAPLLEAVVDQAGGNLCRAADILGIHRATLRRKLNQYGLI